MPSLVRIGIIFAVQLKLNANRCKRCFFKALVGGRMEFEGLEHIDDIIWGYCQLRGVSKDNAIWHYLDEIRRLANYGVQLFSCSVSDI